MRLMPQLHFTRFDFNEHIHVLWTSLNPRAPATHSQTNKPKKYYISAFEHVHVEYSMQSKRWEIKKKLKVSSE